VLLFYRVGGIARFAAFDLGCGHTAYVNCCRVLEGNCEISEGCHGCVKVFHRWLNLQSRETYVGLERRLVMRTVGEKGLQIIDNSNFIGDWSTSHPVEDVLRPNCEQQL